MSGSYLTDVSPSSLRGKALAPPVAKTLYLVVRGCLGWEDYRVCAPGRVWYSIPGFRGSVERLGTEVSSALAANSKLF
jgi:hypothetical protein